VDCVTTRYELKNDVRCRQIIARVPCQGEGLACNSTSMRRSELAVLVQSLILRAVTASDRRLEFPEKNNTDGGSIPFPTE